MSSGHSAPTDATSRNHAPPQHPPATTDLDFAMGLNSDTMFLNELPSFEQHAPYASPNPLAPHTTSTNPPATSTAPHYPSLRDIEALLDNPLTAALVSAQLKARRSQHPTPTPTSPPPHPAAPTPPAAHAISKSNGKKKKIRPKDKLDVLQKHLETVVDQVKHLSIRNRQLHKKKEVLEDLVREIERCEAVADKANADIAYHKAHPQEPPRGAAVYKDWTPQQFITFYRGEIGRSSKWIINLEGATGAAVEEAVRQLDASTKRIMDVVFFACHSQQAFIPHVKQEMAKQFPDSSCEGQHWQEVVQALELTEGQVEDLLVAREVFFSIMVRLEQEQEAVQVSIHKQIELASTPDSLMHVMCVEDDVVAQIADNLRKRAGFVSVVAMFIFLRALTPLQGAKCALHSHPLFPDPVNILNVIYDQHGHNPSIQALLNPKATPAPTPPAPLPPSTTLPPPRHPTAPLPISPPMDPTRQPSSSSSGSLSRSLGSSSSGSLGWQGSAVHSGMQPAPPPASAAPPAWRPHSYFQLLQNQHLLPLDKCCPPDRT